ncbi:hypothetical protein JG688_00009843 [Phytophthora aleatoria]|uniref:Uncharacterized protein n=1 Tax=Phytophthora aleatoria TaxID=2496075 RepID=A0A8J5M3R2_9STRA|nr:hypothetical protein JG688_00009843 [Phytophthora aleatoria]
MGNVSGCCKGSEKYVATTPLSQQPPPEPSCRVPPPRPVSKNKSKPNQRNSTQRRRVDNGGSTSYASTMSSDYTPYVTYGGHHGGYDGGIGGGCDAGGGGCDAGGGGGGGCDAGGG